MRISPEAAALAAAKAEAAEKKTEKPAIGGQGKVVSNTMFGDSLFGAKPASSTGGGIFGANPFSSGEGASTSPFTQSNPLSAQKPAEKPAEKPMSPTADLPKTFAAALNITSPPPSAPQPAEPWPQDSDLPKPYPLLYLADADYEQLDKDEPAPLQKFEMMELDTEPSGSGGGKEDKDVYESSIDTTFQKFADRLAQNPEQVVRYEFRGSPLLYTKGDGVGKLLGGEKGKGMPNCPNCKSKRVFEVQCAPHMITELEVEELSLEGMEWGTIIVGVCGADCCPNVRPGQVGYVEEWVGVQWEEVEDRKR